MTPKTEYRTFDDLKRAFENAYHTYGSTGCGVELLDLSRVVAASVIAKLVDPRKKSAVNDGAVSASGVSPVMLQLRRELHRDGKSLDRIREACNRAYAIVYRDGETVTEIVDTDAAAMVDELISDTIGDGYDLAQEAAAALLEAAEEHAHRGGGWLDAVYTVRKLDRRVLIREDSSAKWHDDEDTPMQSVYRAVRGEVENAQAVRSASGKYVYLDEYAAAEDGASERLYRRLDKYADIGGYAVCGTPSTYGGPSGVRSPASGLYTAGEHSYTAIYEIVRALNLTPRQAEIVKYRLRGYGDTAIASRLGVTVRSVELTRKRIQKELEKFGISPKNK